MTVLTAYEKTNFWMVNLNYWYNVATFADQQFNDNNPLNPNFEDDAHLLSVDNDILSYYGSDFVVDTNLDPYFVSDGFLQDVVQWKHDGTEYVQRWVWEEWDMPLYFVWEAGQTETSADDMILIEFVLRGDDTFNLSEDDDNMNAYVGDDIMNGFGGDDTLRGGYGKDVIDGGDGRDHIIGDVGADTLYGGALGDKVRGGLGKDTLNGGDGWDLLIGGGAQDTFVFDQGTDRDVVLDFKPGFDKIDLTDFGLGGLTFAEFRQMHIKRFGPDKQDAKIDLGDGDIIILEGVHKNDLDADDFLL